MGILRARGGSSKRSRQPGKILSVFSAHAEVVPGDKVHAAADGSILRARGGSSVRLDTGRHGSQYSPRTRR